MTLSRFALLAGAALLVPLASPAYAGEAGHPHAGAPGQAHAGAAGQSQPGGAGQSRAGGAMHVYKTPWCGCCTAWADRMSAAGFTVSITELEDLGALRREAAIPEEIAGCHVATIDGYVLEGHVPVPAIEKLLSEGPPVRGIAVPGMPAGSPGMGDDPAARYDVVTFGAGTLEGSTVFYEAGR